MVWLELFHPGPAPTPAEVYQTMLGNVFPAERPSVEAILNFLIGDNFPRKLDALSFYLRNQLQRCDGKAEGDLCNFFPPAFCNFDGRLCHYWDTRSLCRRNDLPRYHPARGAVDPGGRMRHQRR